jgi:hypothetical protein
VDAATCFFGDANALPPDHQLPISLLPSGPHEARILEDGGLALVVCGTGGDQEMPVEVGWDGEGRAAARMCFTTDVDTLEGSW